MFLLITKDNYNNDYKERVFDLKAKTKTEALKEAKDIILEYRFGEERADEGPEDSPNSIFSRSSSFYMETAKLLEVSDIEAIDSNAIKAICNKWAKEWKKNV